jgi:predicted nucleic acid-binding Zn ribbon protein
MAPQTHRHPRGIQKRHCSTTCRLAAWREAHRGYFKAWRSRRMKKFTHCAHCGGPIGAWGRRFCGAACRVAAELAKRKHVRRPTLCTYCAGPLKQNARGNPRLFCSDMCRKRADDETDLPAAEIERRQEAAYRAIQVRRRQEQQTGA